EDDPRIPALRKAWLDGYQRCRRLDEYDLAIIDTVVMLRRLALLAWIGSHHTTDLAREHAPDFAQRTAQLAQRYLES
ncbi:MAG: aminoglycoside phosphotransferase, partial [Pseudomonadota bacterium]